ncbi:MAG: 6-bladed beta-propeller [bacterium]
MSTCDQQLTKAAWRLPRNRAAMVAFFAKLAVLALLLAIPACNTMTSSDSESNMPVLDRAWPPPPEAARVTYLHSLKKPADCGIRQSWLARTAKRIVGGGRENTLWTKPFGIALDENDNICLTDTGMRTVYYFDRVHGRWQSWDHIGKIRFVTPVAIAKHLDTFYVADSGLGCVLVFRSDGHLLRRITEHLAHPSGLAILGDRLLVVDSRRHCVVVFDSEGEYVAEFGCRGAGPAEFNFPTHITTDASGSIYVTDSMNNRVQVLDCNGNFQSAIGSIGDTPGFFNRPKGVAVDSLGHVYVVDANSDDIQIFDSKGRMLLWFGASGQAEGQFWLPNGIAISRQNEIFVTDTYNRRVQVFKYLGDSTSTSTNGASAHD